MRKQLKDQEKERRENSARASEGGREFHPGQWCWTTLQVSMGSYVNYTFHPVVYVFENGK